ncbi:MAG: HDIG domain-containing metalloprotein [Bacteroidota bacterium]
MDISKTRLSYFYKTIFFVATIALIVFLFPKEYKFKYQFQTGKPWMYDDLIAPFDFTINKLNSEINSEKENIIKDTKPYYIFDKSSIKTKRNQLITNFNTTWQDNNPVSKKHYLDDCLSIFDSIYKTGVIRLNELEINSGGETNTVYIIYDNVALEKPLNKIFNIRKASQFIDSRLMSEKNGKKASLQKLLENSLVQNIYYSSDYTYKQQYLRIKNISLTKGVVQKDERIISKGELVDQNRFQILQSLKEQYEGSTENQQSFYYILFGQIILISIAIIMLVLFLLMFRIDIIADNKKTLLILTVIILMVFITSLMIRHYAYEYIYVLPLCIVPLIIRTFFDTRLALFVHLITIILIGFLVPDGFEFIFLQLISGIVTIISIVRIEKRAQFFITSIYIFFTYSLIYIGMSMLQTGSYMGITSQNFMYFSINSALTLLAYPMIVLYERLFGYVTNISLLEYSNTNNKLLRELSQKAAATFQHSLQVANLAEEAARRIGANALLIRTGAMYHDVGKMENSMFFTENQINNYNPHGTKNYAESAAIVIRHVELGVAIARKHGLPEQLIDFIRTHHGTKRTEYFYTMQKMEQPDHTNENDFRYPGPCPFSKETALLMMADAVEAASRSLKMPDKQSLSDLVEHIVDSQIDQKQFKNVDITLRDISRVKSVFKTNLMNKYHLRVEYPK